MADAEGPDAGLPEAEEDMYPDFITVGVTAVTVPGWIPPEPFVLRFDHPPYDFGYFREHTDYENLYFISIIY